MNKKELISSVAEKTGLSKKDVESAFSHIFETIKEVLADKDAGAEKKKIAIKGFGTFSVKERAAKKGRHPKTGESLQIPARSVPYFSAGSELKEVIANPKKGGGKKAPAAPKKKEAAAPKKEAAAPKKEAAAPKKEAAAPKKEAAAPKKEAAAPKKDAKAAAGKKPAKKK
jgi:DNA-binding protein HU-beta